MLNIQEAISNFGNMTMATLSEESLILDYKQATERKNKKGEVTSYAVKGDAVPESISIHYYQTKEGDQCLDLKKKTELVASFIFRNDNNYTMEWRPCPQFGTRGITIAKPLDPDNDVIVSYSLYNFFEKWILSKKFSVGLNQLAQELVYPPAVVKLLLLFLAYMTERTRQAEILKKLSSEADLNVDKSRIAVMYHDFLSRLVSDSKRMQRLYDDAVHYIPLPSNKDEIMQLVAQEVDVPEVEKVETKQESTVEEEIIPIIDSKTPDTEVETPAE